MTSLLNQHGKDVAFSGLDGSIALRKKKPHLPQHMTESNGATYVQTDQLETAKKRESPVIFCRVLRQAVHAFPRVIKARPGCHHGRTVVISVLSQKLRSPRMSSRTVVQSKLMYGGSSARVSDDQKYRGLTTAPLCFSPGLKLERPDIL